MNYTEADAFLHTRNKRVPRKKYANNTYLHRHDDGRITLRLHNTDIVTWDGDEMSLNTGGWLTVTTKDRINSVLPCGWRLLSERGTWFLSDNDYLTDAQRYRYTDGITLRESMEWFVVPETMLTETTEQQHDRHNAMVRKLVSRYLKDLPEVTDTPCALCMPAATLPSPLGRTLWVTFGDRMEDTQHLLDHIINGVLPMHLVYAALGERGYVMHLTHSDTTVKRSLRAYLSNRLLIGSTAPAHGRKPITTGV